MKEKINILINIISLTLILVITLLTIIPLFKDNTNEIILDDDEFEDLYNQIVIEFDFDELISENEKLESENRILTETCDGLRKYNYELIDKIELYEELQTQTAHESYKECLEKLDDEFYISGYGSLDYIVNQVETRNQDIKTIYHFIIVIYTPDFSVIDLWDCYTIYEDNYFRYANCNLIETKGE